MRCPRPLHRHSEERGGSICRLRGEHFAVIIHYTKNHLPHAGKALSVVILFPHMRVFALMLWGNRYSRIVAFPIGEGGPRQRWIGCSR